ncbi:MAG: hypothetical protein ACPGYY_07640 [Bacteroidia bacterium]|jgi:hypothetical protein
MPQIGSEKNPIRFNVNKKVKIRSPYMRAEDKKKFDDNYDRIFRNPDNPTNHREKD